MATKRMRWIVLAAVMGISLMAGSAFAEDHAFNFNDEVKKGEERAGFTLKVLVKELTYTVGAVAVKDEIKAQGGELTLLDFAQPPFKPDQGSENDSCHISVSRGIKYNPPKTSVKLS